VGSDLHHGLLAELDLPRSTTVLGIGVGGLVAAKLQEQSRPDLHVICIASPTREDGVELRFPSYSRLAIYSPVDPDIGDRVGNWSKLARVYMREDVQVSDPKSILRLGPMLGQCIRTGEINGCP